MEQVLSEISGLTEDFDDEDSPWAVSVIDRNPIDDFSEHEDGECVGSLAEITEITFSPRMAPKKSVHFSFIDEEDFVGSHVEVNTVSSGDDDEVGYVSEVSSRDSQGRSYSAFLDFGLAERHISELTFDDLLLCFNALKSLRLISPLMVFDDRFIGPSKP